MTPAATFSQERGFPLFFATAARFVDERMIRRLEHRRYRLPLRAPVRTAHGVLSFREGVLVRVQDAGGPAGYGEAAPIPGFSCESVEEIVGACDACGGQLPASPELAERIRQTMPSLAGALTAARKAVERSAEEPIIAAKEYRAVAALLPAGRGAVAELRDRATAGFRVFKWKVGVAEAADELGWLDELCAELPEGGWLRLDANGAWDRRGAERWLDRCASRPVEFVEQPVAPKARGSADLLLGLAADYPTPLALDESLVADCDADRWIGAGWRGFYVVKPSLLADADRVLAKLAGVAARVVFSSGLETGVGARSALRHAFAWTGTSFALGFGVWPLFADHRFDGPSAAAFVKGSDVERIDPEAVWNALS